MNKKYNRYNLYCECAREAIKFQGLGDDIDEDVLNFTFDTLTLETDLDWVDIKTDDGELIGFLVVSKNPELFPGIEYDVDCMYILPDYRRQGYMSKMIKKYLEDNPGTYSYSVLVGNDVSLSFWDKIIYDNNCIPIELKNPYIYKEYVFGAFKKEV